MIEILVRQDIICYKPITRRPFFFPQKYTKTVPQQFGIKIVRLLPPDPRLGGREEEILRPACLERTYMRGVRMTVQSK
jgi:hypothetical protein